MKRSEITPMPEYFDYYINLVADVELLQAFDDSIKRIETLNADLLSKLDRIRYADGKWTVKETLQHIIDFERILSYRALLFARREGSVPQSVDENRLAENLNAEKRVLADLINELKIVRAATKALFESFDEETLLNKGTNWKFEISVLAMGFAIIGHQIHHLKTIEEKYLPLIENDGF